jgi:hypothetical protein
METAIVVLLVLGAVAWAARATWRSVRQARKPACGCPSASRCAVARNCAQAPAAENSGTPGVSAGRRAEPKLTTRQSS